MPAQSQLAFGARRHSRRLVEVFRFSYKLLPTLQEVALVVNLGSSLRGIVPLSEVMLDE
jgi:hypothetical protein